MAYHEAGQQHHQHYGDHPSALISEQISRHHDLERGLNRMEASHGGDSGGGGPVLAQVVMEECREAKIRRQNKQIAMSVGIAIGLIGAVIWFVVSR